MSIIGFFLGIYLICILLPVLLGRNGVGVKKEEFIKEKMVISFSLVIPIMFLALVALVVVGLRIANSMSEQGHGDFIYFSLVFPCFSFFIGYLYFKKMVQR